MVNWTDYILFLPFYLIVLKINYAFFVVKITPPNYCLFNINSNAQKCILIKLCSKLLLTKKQTINQIKNDEVINLPLYENKISIFSVINKQTKQTTALELNMLHYMKEFLKFIILLKHLKSFV